MTPDEKVYIAGHTGLAGSALLRCFRNAGYRNIVTRKHRELDLSDQGQVSSFFERERPSYVLLAAAKVGGIMANNTYRADFIYQNLMIQSNVIHAAFRFGVRKLMFLGSSCVYPRLSPQPIKEEYLLSAPLESTNEPYAIAKIAGIKTCAAYNRQHRTNFLSVMPTNLYGPGDTYDPENSHVIPALIHKMHQARIMGVREVVIWGTGEPRREFLYSDDFAEASLLLMQSANADDIGECINIGTGTDQSIRQVAEVVAEVVGFSGRLRFDTAKPDGTPRKLLDSSRIHAFGWKPRTELREGLSNVYEDYLARHTGKSR